jgi:hypothetical protein
LPANNEFRTFNLSDLVVSIRDNIDGLLDIDSSCKIISIYCDEPRGAKGKGNTKAPDDMVILDNCSFKVRAQRDGSGNGRVYGITFEAKDKAGNVAYATCFITIAHDKSGKPAINNGPNAGYSIFPHSN